MNVDYTRLQKKYADMSEAEFDLIKREDLAEGARVYYDQEKMRRTPGWKYVEPTPERKVGIRAKALLLSRKRIKRRVTIRLICVLAGIILLSLLGLRLAFPMILLLASFQMEMKRGGHLVVWLRRFHRRERGLFKFRDLLSSACNGIGMPITIQDSTFRFSSQWAFVQVVPYMPLLMILIAVFIWGLVRGDSYVNQSLLTALLCVYALIVCAFAVVILRRLGHKRLKHSNARQWILALTQKIRRGRGRYDHVIVVKCANDFWRDTVSAALENADAVIIDVTDPTENIVWELETALGRMPPESIILACAVNPKAPHQLPAEVSLKLQSAVDELTLVKMPQFFFTANGLRLFRGKGKEIQALSDILIRCISYSGHESVVSFAS